LLDFVEYFSINVDLSESGLESVARGFVKDPAMKVDRWFSDDISKHLFETSDDFGRPFHFDLVSINIQRGRDHGIPSYLKFREFCRLTPITSWADMRNFVMGDVVDVFMRLYKFVDDVDLFSASLSEIKQDGSIVGPTLTCMLSNQFHDIKFGDRFWYETSANPGSFTPSNNLMRKENVYLGKKFKAYETC
jgi:peroxidase